MPANLPNIGFADGHCDTITKAMNGNQSLDKNSLHVDLERLKAFGAPLQVFAVYCDKKFLDTAFEYANRVIDFFEKEIEKYSDKISIVHSADDIIQNARDNKISAILALEGGEPLEGKMENLLHFHSRGVRLVTLTWSRENELGFGVSENDSGQGLKPFGVECIEEMNRLGMIIDVSHINEAGFWDVYKLSEKPFMASHSNAYSVANHRRNLKDDQIKALVEKDGFIGLNLCPHFLGASEKPGLEDIKKHFEHFIKLGAAGNIGLGCDLDGIDSLPLGFSDISSLETLEQNLIHDFGEKTTSSIMRGNLLEFFLHMLK
jgi:membrane dipeptidase